MKNNIRLLYLHNFLTDLRFHGAFLVIYLAQITGSYTAAMSILALETVTSALMDIPTGVFSDRVGRKYTLAAGSACMTAGLACYAFAHGDALLCLAALFHGLGLCLFNGNNNALLFETLKAEGKEKQFHHYQGRTSSMFQLALGSSALAAFCIGMISDRWGAASGVGVGVAFSALALPFYVKLFRNDL